MPSGPRSGPGPAATPVPADAVANSYSSPRRLAIVLHDVLAQQPDITEETTGPAVKIAFKDGVPTPAAEAFARKSGVAVADLKTISTPKGEYLAATALRKGRSAAEVLVAELPKEIASIYWAKNMYWRAGKPERFVRPVLWLVALLGEVVVPVTFAGKTAWAGIRVRYRVGRNQLLSCKQRECALQQLSLCGGDHSRWYFF